MLQILLLILKIIGIILLSILAFLILMAVLLLFVPWRYRINFEKKEDIKADGKMSWLLHIVSMRVLFFEGKKKIALYIFGIKIYDSTRPKKVKKAKIKKTKKSKKTKKNKNDNNNIENESSEIDVIDKGTDSFTEDITGHNVTEISETAGISDENKPEKESIFTRIKKIIISVIDRIKSFFISTRRMVSELKRKKDVLIDFLTDATNKTGIKTAWGHVRYLIKVISPKKIRGSVNFGTGDPCTTGQLLGLISAFYGKYAASLNIYPDFQDKIFEAVLKVKGRIRIWTVLRIVIRVLRDKDIKYLRNSFSSLGDDIKRPEAA